MGRKEHELWQEVMGRREFKKVTLGEYFSQGIADDPKRVLFSLSHYKFAKKLIGDGKEILEVGCTDGLGTTILEKNSKSVVAIDFDERAIEAAKESFKDKNIEFRSMDFLGAKLGEFDAIVSLDVIEHIYPENEDLFFKTITDNLKEYGIGIIGTPNINASKYASEGSEIGHVNLYDWKRFQESVSKYFHNTFLFSGNDEIIHTGFYPMAHYFICLGVGKRG